MFNLDNFEGKIINILEDNNFSCSGITDTKSTYYYIEFGQDTPIGEDWYVSVYFNKSYSEDELFDNFIFALEEYVDDFDPDEEAELWIFERGRRGVPSSIRALIDDADWKLKTLKDLVKAFKDAKDKMGGDNNDNTQTD